MKKLPPSLARKEIFSEKLGHLVQLQGHAALLAGSSILVQNTLGDSLVNDDDCILVSNLSSGAVTLSDSSVKLLDNGLTTYDLEARRHSGLSFMQVMQTQKRERELMKRMEFVPHTLENNNGEAAYTTDESSEEE